MTLDQSEIAARIDRSAAVISSLKSELVRIERACASVRACLRGGRRLYSCGNGGSAAEAMHLTEELIGKYRSARAPYPAVCLNADPTALTCIANDYGYANVFARQVEALCSKGDVLVVFSTSGVSENILLALRAARARGTTTIGLLGKTGGPAAELCDVPLVVPAPETEHIQEAHQVILHLMLEAVERP